MRSRLGFTLIELLVVIAIIAVLAVVVVLTLNPAQLLQQSRDANRISDMATLNSAIGLYSTDQSGVSGYSLGSSASVYLSLPDASSTCGTSGLSALPTSSLNYVCASSANYRLASSTGWIPVNFQKISSGAPFGTVPVDPVNQTSSNFYYSYQTNGSVFSLSTFLESSKYAKNMLTTGGTDAGLYQIGSGVSTLPSEGRGLVGYWPLNEGTGSSTVDWSGGGNNGTWHGTATGTSGYYSPGHPWQWGAAFDGTTTYISPIAAISFSSTTPWTFSSWLNWTNLGTANSFYAGAGTGNKLLAVRVGSSNQFAFRDQSSNYTMWAANSSNVVLNTWGLVTWVADGAGNLSLYVNGTLLQTKSGVDTTVGFLHLGAGYNSGANLYAGYMSDVRIYNRALSATEILQLYNSGK